MSTLVGTPSHSHSHSHKSHHAHVGNHTCTPADLLVLSAAIAGHHPHKHNHAHPRQTITANALRRPQMDPLILETAAATGPHVTRNHYLHEYYPHRNPYQRSDLDHDPPSPSSSSKEGHTHVHPYESKQAPRDVRLAKEREKKLEDEDDTSALDLSDDHRRASTASTSTARHPRRPSSSGFGNGSDTTVLSRLLRHAVPPPLQSTSAATMTLPQRSAPVTVQCQVRARIPTPHGDVFLHVYRNSLDDKEHLAFVFDRPQLNGEGGGDEEGEGREGDIRSRSLDAQWREGETDMERIVRGAYVGRLSQSHASASSSSSSSSSSPPQPRPNADPPLVRIHSECFTGETIGSQRCDCGEQLDESFRLASSSPSGRGIVVYLRQEGRGIGLAEKMRAYNLQDLGYDTVAANLILGHGADMRNYAVAAGILRDLGVGVGVDGEGGEERGGGVRLMTNNPDKMSEMEREGVRVLERVPMVPRSWRVAPPPPSPPPTLTTTNGKRSQCRRCERNVFSVDPHSEDEYGYGDGEGEESMTASFASDESTLLAGDASPGAEREREKERQEGARKAGVGMIGGSMTRSIELDRYLRTKIERMGHLLVAPDADKTSKDVGGVVVGKDHLQQPAPTNAPVAPAEKSTPTPTTTTKHHLHLRPKRLLRIASQAGTPSRSDDEGEYEHLGSTKSDQEQGHQDADGMLDFEADPLSRCGDEEGSEEEGLGQSQGQGQGQEVERGA